MTSLVVPVYNGVDVLPHTVDAALAVGADETVYVDDGSTDGTGAWLNNRLSAEPTARVVDHEQNRGRAAARNTGIADTTGDVLLFVDADLAPRPGYLDAHLRALSSPNVVASVGRVEVAEPDLSEPYRHYFATGRRGPQQVGRADWRFFTSGVVAVRREALLAAGGFDERIAYGEDLALACALARSHPDGLVYSTGAVGDVYDVSTLPDIRRKLAQFAAGLALVAERCPDVYRLAGLERLVSERAVDRALAVAARWSPPARLAEALLGTVPPSWTPRVVRYLLGHTLAVHLRHAPHPGARTRA